jgi:crotonobetainyl-CoA:carnitine CoA-transferase CaiB-like acyl-CoA transferase
MPDSAPWVGPLRDLRVLDLSRHFPGGRCSLLLSDLGADVVKIELPVPTL